MAEREGMSRLIADADKFLDELDEEDFNILKYVDPEYALKAEQDNKLKLLPGESLEELTEAEKAFDQE